jgi:hypothetical protein
MACVCVILIYHLQRKSIHFFEKCFKHGGRPLCGGDDCTALQFPSAAAAQTTELRLAFLRQEVAIGRGPANYCLLEDKYMYIYLGSASDGDATTHSKDLCRRCAVPCLPYRACTLIRVGNKIWWYLRSVI